MASGHGHGCEHCVETGKGLSLYSVIDVDSVVALNEETDGSGSNVFVAYEDRFEPYEPLVSDADAQLLIVIPFTASVTLQSVVVMGDGEVDAFPAHVKLFANPRPGLDFTLVDELTPTQELDLGADPEGLLPHPVLPPKFSGITSLAMYITANGSGDEDEQTRIKYIGLGGKASALVGSREVVITAYESRPQPKDHKAGADALGGTSGVF